MLDNNYDLKEYQLKEKIMQNRLKRLEEEELRAQKSKKVAEKKARDLLDTRKKYHEDLLDKLNQYELRVQQNMQQKMKNREA